MSPAAPKRSRSTFWEILVQGNPDRCHGLITGLAVGTASQARIFFARDAGIRVPMGEKILDLMHAHAGVAHVVADSAGRKLLRSHSKQLSELGFKISDEKRILSARFEYDFHAYAKRYGDEIKTLLKSLPKGIQHESKKTKETKDLGAKGVEAYSPVHDYEIQGGGAISGPVDLVLEVREALDDHPLVNAGSVELETE
ncbi:MAG TPA: hypothetical protein VKU85_19760 [bacterium]|nr:hypothetical protein [bacterium]